MKDNLRRVDVVVALYINEDADVNEVLENMDYDFQHLGQIVDTEIVDVITEI